MPDPTRDDVEAIRRLIARQFASLSWKSGKPPEWADFQDDFHSDAMLYASARPARAQSPAAFVARMRALAETSLRTFEETLLGAEIRVFGNVAVAIAACEATENDAGTNRNVEMMLLVKDKGRWQIAAQAWDKADEALPIPDGLLMGRQSS